MLDSAPEPEPLAPVVVEAPVSTPPPLETVGGGEEVDLDNVDPSESVSQILLTMPADEVAPTVQNQAMTAVSQGSGRIPLTRKAESVASGTTIPIFEI